MCLRGAVSRLTARANAMLSSTSTVCGPHKKHALNLGSSPLRRHPPDGRHGHLLHSLQFVEEGERPLLNWVSMSRAACGLGAARIRASTSACSRYSGRVEPFPPGTRCICLSLGYIPRGRRLASVVVVTAHHGTFQTICFSIQGGRTNRSAYASSFSSLPRHTRGLPVSASRTPVSLGGLFGSARAPSSWV